MMGKTSTESECCGGVVFSVMKVKIVIAALQQQDIGRPPKVRGALGSFLVNKQMLTLHSLFFTIHNALCVSLRSDSHADLLPPETFANQVCCIGL